MNFPALDLVAMASRIHGGVPSSNLSYSGGYSSDSGVSGTVEAGVDFRTNGTVDWLPDGYSGDPAWITGVFTASDYEIMATMVSGTSTPSGDIPFGSFLPMDEPRFLKLSRTTRGEEEAVFDITLREILDPLNITVGRVTLSVNFAA